MDPKKVQAIVDWPATRSMKDLRSFLGLANYYMKFINLKDVIASEPILKLLDFECPFEVHIDVSDKAVGGVLVQEPHHLAFGSRKLNDVEQRYLTHEKEMMCQVQDGTMRQYWIEDDILHFKGGRIVVPNGGGLHKDLMKEVHHTTWVGHLGVERMLALLSRVNFLPKMEYGIEVYVNTCHICQVDKTECKKEVGLLQPLPIPERPWLSFFYNLLKSSAAKMSPFEIVLGRQPVTPLDVANTKNQGKCPVAYRV
ncbi:hypothetical protein MTR67_006835 [Solanum verrucosum]|uniref:Uncharacterized protein n=1 Tax=Solanum verrucosum TaxID=315347 RepID=A0AAF0THK6_SOLVR|nr:hypothetical protein MTR67_006835 [Solanum verrucosum]